jgi:hypothetical protein
MSAFIKKTVTHSSALLALCVFSGSAFAGSGGSVPEFFMTWDTTASSEGPLTYDPADFGKGPINLGNGQYQYIGDLTGDGGDWFFEWNCIVRPNTQNLMGGGGGSFVDAQIVVTNNSASTQTFSVLMSLGTSIAGPTTTNGNVAATISNTGFTGTQILGTAGSSSVYSGFIDLNDPMVDLPAATLWDPGYSLEQTGFGTNSDGDSFSGLPGDEVTSNIALLLTFTLTAGASATVTGFFQVIPGPASIALFGLLGLGGRRRRR